MIHPFFKTTPKLHPMINQVTCQIIARKEKRNKAGVLPISLQAFVNKQRVVIPLYKYIPEKDWDERLRCVKKTNPEAIYHNSDIANARHNVAAIVAEANLKKVLLTADKFRAKLTQSISNSDFIQFAFDELEKRKPEIKHSTYLQHKSSLGKLKKFKPVLSFSELEQGTVIDYERWLKSKGNKINTVWAAQKTFKTYINLALVRGFEFPNPFKDYELKKGHTRKVFLTIPELHKLLDKYRNDNLPERLKISLLVFLVECFTSLRISDIRSITESCLIDDELQLIPQKTSGIQKTIRFKPPQIALQLLAELFAYKKNHTIKAEQKINDDLKLIALYAEINKPITTHVGRHTFATTYLSLKGTERGTIHALQKILGHSCLETTMIYVHLIDESINEQLKNFDNEFKW